MASSVIVRAYDWGGFGDIAGAMRVASHLQRTGTETRIKAKSQGALQKLKLLNPDVEFGLNGNNGNNNEVIHVDVAGHYMDERNQHNRDVPHHFTEDMDNPQSRRKLVPVYMKTGLLQWVPEIPVQFRVQGGNPMFYRPFREWDLPKPEERDARKQILEALNQSESHVKKGIFGFIKSKTQSLESVLQKTEKIGFVHLSPQILEFPPETIFGHPYFYAVHTAKINFGKTFGIGLFLGPTLEKRLTKTALRRYWNVVSSRGEVLKYNPDLPTLFFLGQQPQITTTGLFLSSNIPNLVTGDLSLSDAIYGLIAMEGQGFFYETPGWKIPTNTELTRILREHNETLACLYAMGSNGIRFVNEKGEELNDEYNKFMAHVISVFGDEDFGRAYTNRMREAIRAEIKKRFGDVPVGPIQGNGKNGFYIPPGAPYLLQDATARVVETLRDDSDVFSEVENVRKALQEGVPLIVNVSTGVLEPVPTQPTSSKEPAASPFIYFDGFDKNLEIGFKKGKEFYNLEKWLEKELPEKKLFSYNEKPVFGNFYNPLKDKNFDLGLLYKKPLEDKYKFLQLNNL